jgi:hypothetical protein
LVVLGGTVVIVLATTPTFAASNPAKNDRLLGDKNRSKTSFGGEEKPSAPYLKSLQQVEDPCEVWQ